MLVNGSELSGQRRRQGAKMMASALGDMRFTSSSRATLRSERQLGRGWPGQQRALAGSGQWGYRRDPHPTERRRHLLDQVEDEPLQGVVIGFGQVLQDGIDGGQLLLLLRQL